MRKRKRDTRDRTVVEQRGRGFPFFKQPAGAVFLFAVALFVFAACGDPEAGISGTGEEPDSLPAACFVSFYSNGWDTATSVIEVDSGGKLDPPEDPVWGEKAFDGWCLDFGTYRTRWDFESDTVARNISLFAVWKFTSLEDMDEYLATQTGTRVHPADLSLAIDLASGWDMSIETLAGVKKYVYLDLSACNTGGSEFAHETAGKEGAEYIAGIVLPEAATSIGEDVFSGCVNLERMEFPANLTKISKNAFSGCENLSQIELPADLTEIGESAFSGCVKLARISRETRESGAAEPNGNSGIGVSAFSGCVNLISVELPANLPKISASAFSGCVKLAEIKLPANLTEIEEGAFSGHKNLTLVEFPANLTKISKNAFSGCENLSQIELPANLTEIGESAFSGCVKLTRISRGTRESGAAEPNGNSGIGGSAFSGCVNLTSVELPANLTKISASAFSGCVKLAEIKLPANLTEIEEGAFSGHENLTSAELPANLTEISKSAFSGCVNLERIICRSVTPPTLGAGAFDNTHSNLEIMVPAEAVVQYTANADWQDYSISAINE